MVSCDSCWQNCIVCAEVYQDSTCKFVTQSYHTTLFISSVPMASKWTRGRSKPSGTGPNHSQSRSSNASYNSPTSIAGSSKASVFFLLPSLPCSEKPPGLWLGTLKLEWPSRSSRRTSALLLSRFPSPVHCGSGRPHHRRGSSAVPTPRRAFSSLSLCLLLLEASPGGAKLRHR